jgi:hydrogenase maturation factor HypF (carbamoyltransferase family)
MAERVVAGNRLAAHRTVERQTDSTVRHLAFDTARVTSWRVSVRWVVQGVGFRPYIYKLATRLGLAGTVRNTVEARGHGDFTIERSQDGDGFLPIAPDIATCAACVKELLDPADRERSRH